MRFAKGTLMRFAKGTLMRFAKGTLYASRKGFSKSFLVIIAFFWGG